MRYEVARPREVSRHVVKTRVRCAVSLRIAALVSLFVTVISLLSVDAQDSLTRARELYRSAAYDEALNVLGRLRVETTRERSEISGYKAMCFIALGQTEDAARLIASVVAEDPLYTFPQADTAPSLRDMFKEVRRAALPSVVSREYAAAKAAFDRKDARTSSLFDRLLLILDDPDLEMPEKADLRDVATGFRALSLRFPPSPAGAASDGSPR